MRKFVAKRKEKKSGGKTKNLQKKNCSVKI